MTRVIDMRAITGGDKTADSSPCENGEENELVFSTEVNMIPIESDIVFDIEKSKLSDTELLAIRSAATFVEIVGGQPLDRIKVNMQMPKTERVPLKDLLQRGVGEFYAASTTSIIQRCFFYIPALYLGYDLWDRNFKVDDPFQNGILASCFASAIVTPGVSSFENLKTEQQLGRFKGQSMFQISRNLFAASGFKGVFPSLPSTFGRESVFACGICYLTPTLHTFMKDNGFDSVVAAGCITGVVTQLMTHPLDTIKTWQENKKTGFVRSVRDIIKTEGSRFMFNGVAPRCARGMWTFTCLYFCINKFTCFYEKNRGY